MNTFFRNSRLIFKLPLIMLFPLVFSPLAEAHEGVLKKVGCHNDKKNNDYHCHKDNKLEKPQKKPKKISTKEYVTIESCYDGDTCTSIPEKK